MLPGEQIYNREAEDRRRNCDLPGTAQTGSLSLTIAKGAYQPLSCSSLHQGQASSVFHLCMRVRVVGAGGECPLLRFYGWMIRRLQPQKFRISPCQGRAPTGGRLRAPAPRVGPTPGRGRGSSPPGPDAAAGRAGPGAPGAARRLLEEAWRAAARGCAPVCVQSGSAGCAPSRAAMRKQTHGNSSAPSARSPRARRRRRLGSPRARPPGRPPAAPPAPCGPAPPPPARAPSAASPRARARAPRAPRGPPGSWPPESEVRAMRRDPGGRPARRGPGKFLASPCSAALGGGARAAGGRAGREGAAARPGVTSCPTCHRGGLRGEGPEARRGRAQRGRGEGPEELSPPRRGSSQPGPRPGCPGGRLPGWRGPVKRV